MKKRARKEGNRSGQNGLREDLRRDPQSFWKTYDGSRKRAPSMMLRHGLSIFTGLLSGEEGHPQAHACAEDLAKLFLQPSEKQTYLAGCLNNEYDETETREAR
jgi:hypothetical protein